MSVANRKDSAVLLNLFYPSRSDFSHALLFALPALLCAVLIFVRRAGMPKVIVASWHMIRGLVALAAIVQIGDIYMTGKITRYHAEHFSSYYTTFIELAMLLAVIGYCIVNRRFKDVSAQYPQPLKKRVINSNVNAIDHVPGNCCYVINWLNVSLLDKASLSNMDAVQEPP